MFLLPRTHPILYNYEVEEIQNSFFYSYNVIVIDAMSES